MPGNSQTNFKDKEGKKKMLILLPSWVEKDSHFQALFPSKIL